MESAWMEEEGVDVGKTDELEEEEGGEEETMGALARESERRRRPPSLPTLPTGHCPVGGKWEEECLTHFVPQYIKVETEETDGTDRRRLLIRQGRGERHCTYVGGRKLESERGGGGGTDSPPPPLRLLFTSCRLPPPLSPEPSVVLPSRIFLYSQRLHLATITPNMEGGGNRE